MNDTTQTQCEMEGGLTQKPVNQSRSYQLSLVTLWDLQHVLCSVWLCSCIEKKNGRLFSQIMWEEMHKSLRTMATKVYKHNGSKKFQLQSIELHIIHNMQQRVVQTKVVM